MTEAKKRKYTIVKREERNEKSKRVRMKTRSTGTRRAVHDNRQKAARRDTDRDWMRGGKTG